MFIIAYFENNKKLALEQKQIEREGEKINK